MGFGMGAAIGACIGSGFQRTILFTSDGSFHMNLNELATAVSNNLPLLIVVLNNNALGMVRQWQTLFFGKRYSNTELNRKTNFSELAKSFGAKGLFVDDYTALKNAIDFAFEQKGPVLVDVLIDVDERVLPMIPPGGTITDAILN
jgi:acetolactate synthase-1/2/3 large subunit